MRGDSNVNNSEWQTQTVEMTQWTNPTRHDQSVEINLPKKVRVTRAGSDGLKVDTLVDGHDVRRTTWSPGETKALPSTYDRAIHRVVCSDRACSGKPECSSPAIHKGGYVIAGLAPLLRRENQAYGIHRALIPALEPRTKPIDVADIGKALERRDADEDDPALIRARARRGTR